MVSMKISSAIVSFKMDYITYKFDKMFDGMSFQAIDRENVVPLQVICKSTHVCVYVP